MATRLRRDIPLLDLSAQHTPIREEILSEVTRLIDSQRFIMGEEIRQFEEEVASYCEVGHAIACASGSDALYLSLIAAGVGHGDEVITTPFTFFATAGSIVRSGARPVFVDIDPATFNISPDRLAEEAAKRTKVKAVIPVHLYGGCADMDPILRLSRERGWTIIEDGAQAIGAAYKGRPALGIGDAGCLSFFPSKNLGGMGDAGMMSTNDDVLAGKLMKLRVHGETGRYLHKWVGTNSRMDTLQAVILRVKLRYLDQWTAQRQINASRYHRQLDGADIPVTLPQPAQHQTRHVFNQFVVRCAQRDNLRQRLTELGVGTQIYYPVPLHLQECFRDLGCREGDFPEAEKAAREVLALPVAPGLSGEDIEYICAAIKAFYA